MDRSKESLVSIIIPVYNAEKYLKKCIDSILNQSYNEFELLLINDGSTDNSKEIIEQLKKKDKRVVTIHKKNEGVSSARTVGLDVAKGEYILFVDADDYLEKDYIEYFYNLINCSFGLDMAVNYNKFCIHTPYQVKKEKVELLSSEKIMEYIYTSKINEAVWNKIYRRSFLKKNNIIFNKDIWYGEGMLFNMQCLQCTEKIAVGNKRVYHQVYNYSSAMREFNLDSNLCGLKSLDLQRKIWKNENKKVLSAWKFHKWCFNMSILKGIIKSNTKSKYLREYVDCKKKLRRGWYYPWTVDISPLRKLFYVFSSLFPVLGAKIFLYNERKKAKRYFDN